MKLFIVLRKVFQFVINPPTKCRLLTWGIIQPLRIERVAATFKNSFRLISQVSVRAKQVKRMTVVFLSG